MHRKITSYQTRYLVGFALALLCLALVGIQVWRWQKPHYNDMILEGFHSADAKLSYDGYVVTSKNNHLYLVNTKTHDISEVFIRSNWVDCLITDNVIVYGNLDRKIGVCHFDPKDASIINNYLIIDDGQPRIDPSIVKYGDRYFLSATHVQGTVNRASEDEPPGTYTIQLFTSVDLMSWSYIGDVYSAETNLEDIELYADNDTLRLIFEEETLDKAPSAILMIESEDMGQTWSDPITLIDNGADNEPASFYESDDEYWLFYSSDVHDIGASYEGAEAFLARYDQDFQLINITNIKTQSQSNVLLYQAIVENGTTTLLYSQDYLGSDDLCIENMGFAQMQRN